LLGELTNEEIIAQIRSNEKDANMEELKKTNVRDVMHKEAVQALLVLKEYFKVNLDVKNIGTQKDPFFD